MTPDQPTFGNVHITQVGDGNVGQQFNQSQQGKDPLDSLPEDAMASFIRATAESLTVLGLSAAAYAQAERALEEIRSEAAAKSPQRARLRQLATALRQTLEEVAGGALGAVLLGLWHP